MTLFKTFLKVLKQCKIPILLYTILLVFFGGFQLKTSETNPVFTASKPDIYILNQDEEVGLTKSLLSYLEKNNHIIDIKQEKNAINDALFYRDVNCVIQIPKGFHTAFLEGKNPQIEVKSTGDYQASLTKRMLNRYLKVATIYLSHIESEEDLVVKVEKTLSKEVLVEMTSKRDVSSLEHAALYFNFASYSILAGCVYVICLVLSSFQEPKVKKRTIISSMPLHTFNRNLLLSNSFFALLLWLFYVLVGVFLLGDVMLTTYGLLFILNSFVFVFCALCIAFLIGNILQDKNAISGIVNVVALGSSFLCGAFVPLKWLPDTVLKLAHFLPTYYYIRNNELLKQMESFAASNLYPLFRNIGVVLFFAILFMMMTHFISKRKQKIG